MVCGKEASTGGIIATSANQIVPPKFRGPTKCCTIFTRPPFPFAVLNGGLGTRLTTRDEPFIIEDNYTIADSKVTDYSLKNTMNSRWYF